MKWRFVWRIFRFLILFFFITSFLAVIWYRFFPVHVTPLMFERYFEQLVSDKPVVWKHTWVSFDKISHHMPMAVIASEDNRFPYHNGFDVQQIQKAVEERIEKKRIRGASTISQQTAKNVFLWPASNFIRKGFEAYFTFLIESFWSKERIMEVYLNSIEMGRGIYGVQAAAKYKFGTTAKDLTKGQCALIAATLPNPLRFDSANPSPYMVKRKYQIMRIMNVLPTFPPKESNQVETIKRHHHHHHRH
jgi:monofunctional biosynthetic peptidoglycan transglycosylase